MLINCPRCGFQQPKDQYCAQCGIDMERYKAPSPSIFSKIFGNPILQLALVFLIGGGIGYTVYQSGTDNIFKSKKFRASLQINASEKSSFADNESALSEDQESFESSASDKGFSANNSSEERQDLTSKTSSNGSNVNNNNGKDNRAPANINSPQILVYYAEVGRNSLSNLFEASQVTGQFMTFKDYTAGILPNVGKRIQGPGVKILHKEVRVLNSSKTLQWFYGLKDRQNPNIEIGLTTFFELNELDGNNLRGNIEIQRNWREPSANGNIEVQRKSFPAIFEISPENGFFLSGIMPLQSYMEDEDELLSIDIYKILQSAQFRSGESDFVIFIEFSTPMK